MKNKGGVDLTIDGEKYFLFFGWDEIETLKDEIGVDFDMQLANAAAVYDFDIIAKAIEIGLQRDQHKAKPTAEQIRAASPAIITSVDAINKGLSLAMFGNETFGNDEEPESDPIPARILKWIQRKLRISGS